MKAKKLIRYRVPVSLTFPATHPRKGEFTFFKEMILGSEIVRGRKLHTIRGNKKGTAYEIWAKRFEKINKGEAVLELYYWDGKPYGKGVNQVTICQLGKEDGIGLQLLDFDHEKFNQPRVWNNWNEFAMLCKSNSSLPPIDELAKNDGLSLEDFKAWFKGADLSKLMAIIHFTPFRY